jgi:hypothetical protein
MPNSRYILASDELLLLNSNNSTTHFFNYLYLHWKITKRLIDKVYLTYFRKRKKDTRITCTCSKGLDIK